MELLTLKEIAQQLNIPATTLAFYRDKFEKYIPYTGEGRSKKYRTEAIEVFKTISDLYKQGKESESIELFLADNFAINSDNTTITTTAQQSISAEMFTAFIMQYGKNHNEITSKLVELQQQFNELQQAQQQASVADQLKEMVKDETLTWKDKFKIMKLLFLGK